MPVFETERKIGDWETLVGEVQCEMVKTIAPGARILCRDAEWLVKSTAQSSDGGRVIEAVGVQSLFEDGQHDFLRTWKTICKSCVQKKLS